MADVWSWEHAQLRRSLEDLGQEGRDVQLRRTRWREQASYAACEAVASGMDVAHVARLLGVTRRTVYAWLRER